MGSYQTALEEKKEKKKETKTTHLNTYISTKQNFAGLKGKYLICFICTLTKTKQKSSHSEDDMSNNVDHEQLLPIVCELLHQLLPVAAGTQVGLVEAPDVLDDFLSLHALPEGHSLSDIGCNLGNIL